MKKFFITLIVSLCTMQSIIAQDVLITTDGDVMTVYIDDIGSSTIYYKTDNSDAAQLQRIDKSKVYMIKKADGTKIDLSSSSTPTQKATTPIASQPMNTELSEAAKQRNKELIDALNKSASLPEHEKPKDKLAYSFYATIGVEDNSVMCNDDIEISFEARSDIYCGVGRNGSANISFTIKNNTNKTIFIDLAETYFVSNGESSAYYVPTAYSSSTSKTGDANAGTFAGAMGIHDYQTNISTSTVYSQRIISIPPKSYKELDYRQLFMKNQDICQGVWTYWQEYSKNRSYRHVAFRFGNKKESPNTFLKEGEIINFTSSNSPLKFNFYVTYSFEEECKATNQLSVNLYMKRLIGDSKSYSNFNGKNIINGYNVPWFAGYISNYTNSGIIFQRP